MNIAIYSGCYFHYEMFGYIINYCKSRNFKLTIYLLKNSDQGYSLFYNTLFNNYFIEYKEVSEFNIEKQKYDIIFLTTDDDYNFDKSDNNINNKTICIDHYYQIRSPMFVKRVATRPFEQEHYRNWALPVYPIFNSSMKHASINIDKTIIILLTNSDNYNINIINRLRSNKKIVLHAISREMTINKFSGIDNSIDIFIHKNIEATLLFNILETASYVLSDISEAKNYTSHIMSGSIPISFSTLSSLIISKETNSYYQFKNAVEFDKESYDPILLHDIDIQLLEKERDEMIKKNHELFDTLI